MPRQKIKRTPEQKAADEKSEGLFIDIEELEAEIIEKIKLLDDKTADKIKNRVHKATRGFFTMTRKEMLEELKKINKTVNSKLKKFNIKGDNL